MKVKHFQFTEKEYALLSEATGYSVMDLQRLDAMKLLNNYTAIKMVFKYEYDQCKSMKVADGKLIIDAIAAKYGWPSTTVKSILYERDAPILYCSKCNKEITKREYKHYGKMCKECKTKQIKI